MTRSRIAPLRIATVGIVAAIAGSMLCSAATLPSPAVDETRTDKKTEMAVFAGGCFWGIQAVFDATKGVSSAISGYSGGGKDTAHYEMVSTDTTGHAESVQVTFDPSQISFGQLLQIYFSVHDPTQLNRQDPDEGTQYRSEIFYSTDEQKRVAEAYVAAVDCRSCIPQTHRDEDRSASGVLSRRRLPSGLRPSLPAEFAGMRQQALCRPL